MVLVSFVSRKPTYQLTSKSIVDHLDGESVLDFLALDRCAFLLFGPEIGREDLNHTSLCLLVVDDLYWHNFFGLPFLHVDECKNTLFGLVVKEVLVSVSADTFKQSWTFGYLVERHSANLES